MTRSTWLSMSAPHRITVESTKSPEESWHLLGTFLFSDFWFRPSQTPLLVHIPRLMVVPRNSDHLQLQPARLGISSPKLCFPTDLSIFKGFFLAKRHITFFLLVKSKFWIVTPSGLTLVIFIVGNYKIKLGWLNPAFLDQSCWKPRF